MSYGFSRARMPTAMELVILRAPSVANGVWDWQGRWLDWLSKDSSMLVRFSVWRFINRWSTFYLFATTRMLERWAIAGACRSIITRWCSERARASERARVQRSERTTNGSERAAPRSHQRLPLLFFLHVHNWIFYQRVPLLLALPLEIFFAPPVEILLTQGRCKFGIFNFNCRRWIWKSFFQKLFCNLWYSLT